MVRLGSTLLLQKRSPIIVDGTVKILFSPFFDKYHKSISTLKTLSLSTCWYVTSSSLYWWKSFCFSLCRSGTSSLRKRVLSLSSFFISIKVDGKARSWNKFIYQFMKCGQQHITLYTCSSILTLMPLK
jgi:hypothetical protein